ncbi:hypothetical protein PAB09_05260 [Corynebacterium sp. SCR221107]|uniref:hypothetical protein n=1 Tax=Corynebacterium sp. SCR221107 TaxID=3017361 RepID=UPI0022EC1DC6|nr:hypothetical protein [Corynebacterium sp. SCR221107]WBT09712.1 hypothetical protein PAB09_05260 [Corynebacterium sp. SCR221107]
MDAARRRFLALATLAALAIAPLSACQEGPQPSASTQHPIQPAATAIATPPPLSAHTQLEHSAAIATSPAHTGAGSYEPHLPMDATTSTQPSHVADPLSLTPAPSLEPNGGFDVAAFARNLMNAELAGTEEFAPTFMTDGQQLQAALGTVGRSFRKVYGAYSKDEPDNFRGPVGVAPAVGDLNGDGLSEAAVPIIVYPGGSRVWQDIAIYDQAANLLGYVDARVLPATLHTEGELSGDSLEKLEIRDGLLHIDFGIEAPADSSAAAPFRRATAELEWLGDSQVRLASGPIFE